MKRLWVVAALFAVSMIHGCGGGSSGYVGTPGSREVIVFERNNAIFAMAPDGSDVRFVTFGFDPVVSPDGGRIAFAKPASGVPLTEIYTCNLDGSQLKYLASGTQPAWSADGKQIVYLALTYRPRGPSHRDGISLINADGTGGKQLTSGENDEFPAFRPGRNRISFARYVGSGNASGYKLYSVGLDGEDEQYIIDGGYLGHDWSPDGKSLVYVEGVGSKYGASFELFLKNFDSSQAIKLTNEGDFKRQPSFSPDGRKIVFTDDKGTSVAVPPGTSVYVDNLYIMDLATKEVQKITTDNKSENPDWGRF